ncbi:MAG TPA: hypothetical protein VK901_14235 [Nitrospiraceae bacterium]|nr:hypothetical protein [Nitrospiraceae bacterium]
MSTSTESQTASTTVTDMLREDHKKVKNVPRGMLVATFVGIFVVAWMTGKMMN